MYVIHSVLFFAGQGDIILIYTRHTPLTWDQTTLGLFTGTESFLRGIGVLVILPICKKLLTARDTSLLIVGLLSKICSLILLGFGVNKVIMFWGKKAISNNLIQYQYLKSYPFSLFFLSQSNEGAVNNNFEITCIGK